MLQSCASVQVNTVEDGLNRSPFPQQNSQEIYVACYVIDFTLAEYRFKTIIQSLKNARALVFGNGCFRRYIFLQTVRHVFENKFHAIITEASWLAVKKRDAEFP